MKKTLSITRRTLIALAVFGALQAHAADTIKIGVPVGLSGANSVVAPSVVQSAELAVEEKTGARGLMTVCERIFRDLKFELPSTAVKRFVVTRELVDHPFAELQKLLAEHEKEERVVMRQLVHEFAQRFQENHALKITFTEAAADRLVALALEQSKPVRDMCAERFKDFQFGLSLIKKNTGKNNFMPAAQPPRTFLISANSRSTMDQSCRLEKRAARRRSHRNLDASF